MRDRQTEPSKRFLAFVAKSLRRAKRFREQAEAAPKQVQPFSDPPYRIPRWAHVGWRKRWRVRKAQRDAA